MILTRAYVLVAGRVQGVSYREATKTEATKLGLAGMVRNIPDGRVEAIFEGDKPAVEQMVEWCRHGPPSARVEQCDVLWEPFHGDFPDFRMIA